MEQGQIVLNTSVLQSELSNPGVLSVKCIFLLRGTRGTNVPLRQ